ncbi:MAG: glycosyl transferase, group 1 [Streptosporangiaceae bacterium]|nr:glycosyl transferase, group 1 [Streptosporangiaceae bacterium]
MHVLFMAHTWVPETGAGAETCSHALAKALVDTGHRVEVCVTEPAPVRRSYEIDGIAVHHDGGPKTVFSWFGKPSNTPDAVVSYLHSMTRAASLCRTYRIPLVHLCHNEQEFTGHAIRRGPADLVVYNTDYVRESLEAFLLRHGAPLPARSEVIHPPIDRDRYTAAPGDCITHVNLAEVKNPSVFYEMARRFPDQKFLGVQGGYSDQLIIDLPNVEIIPHVRPDEMAERVYARTRILLHPSRYETYGMVAVEAACMGIPALASTSPGLIEALGSAGTFLDPDDHDGYEAALRKLLNPRTWAAASKRAKAQAATLDTAADLVRWVKSVEALQRPVKRS